MAVDTVSPDIIASIGDTNLAVLGDAPAHSMAMVYQVLAHSVGLSMQSVQANHAGMLQIGSATVAVAVAQIMKQIG
jgi:hypothetical protein